MAARGGVAGRGVRAAWSENVPGRCETPRLHPGGSPQVIPRFVTVTLRDMASFHGLAFEQLRAQGQPRSPVFPAE